MAYKIEVDKDACIGCGACAAACADNFEMNGDKAEVKSAQVDDLACNQAAVDGCPVNCIKITEIQ